jgi:ribonuclease-3
LADLAALQESLGVSFSDLSQLRQALIHSSYVNEKPGLALAANERLEFLGDAVLELVVTEKLYQDLPQATEGEMTKLRAALVSRDTLARLAKATGLGGYLYFGKGEEVSGGRDKPANLASALEAVIAAIFLDQALPAAKNFILRLFQPELEKIISQGGIVNYKTQLQELVQARGQPLPVYHLIEARGPDHEPQFTIEVRSGDTVLGQGVGKSKKLAEAEAAHSALEDLSK